MTETMTEYTTRRPLKRAPTHPGALLRDEVLPEMGLSVAGAARRLRVSRQTLHRILAGTSAVTPEMALRLGRLVGNGPTLWLRMQEAHDLWHAEQKLGEELEKIHAGAG